MWKDRAENFNVSLGSLVEVSFSIVGRDVPKKDGGTFHKTELKAWKVEVKEAGTNQQTYAPKTYPDGKVDAPKSDVSELEYRDDLPF